MDIKKITLILTDRYYESVIFNYYLDISNKKRVRSFVANRVYNWLEKDKLRREISPNDVVESIMNEEEIWLSSDKGGVGVIPEENFNPFIKYNDTKYDAKLFTEK